MEKKNTVKRDAITRETVAKALRWMRTEQGLTQKELTRRAVVLGDQQFGKLLPSQVSDFERGRTLPSLGSLLNLLAGCSPDGAEVNFSVLQEALVAVLSESESMKSADGDSEVTLAPLLPLSRCDASDRTLLLSALYQTAQVDPDQVENVENDLPRPKQVVRDLGAALETSERGPALADLLSCSPYMILVVGGFIEAFGKWLLRPDEFSSMVVTVQTATTVPKKKNSFTRFHPYTIPEPVGRTITETIIARGELEQLRGNISWPLPHIVRPSCLEGEADFLYHLILAVIRGDDVLSCRDVLQSGATMALWVGGLLVALGEYHNGDRKAVAGWAEGARSQTIADLRRVLETDEM